MSRVFRYFTLAWVALSMAIASIGCAGSQSSVSAPTTPTPTPTAVFPQAQFVYPTSAPTLAAGQTPSPYYVGTSNGTLVFAVQGGLTASTQLVISPTPPPPPFGNGQPYVLSTSTPSFLPTSLPSPAAGFAYVFAQGPSLVGGTSYAIQLLGCPSGVSICASPSPLLSQTMTTGCGSPPPVAQVLLSLVQPTNGATNVPDGTPSLSVTGPIQWVFGSDSVSLASSSGSSVPVSSFPAPTPSPAPSALFPVFTLTIGALSPSTTYTVSENYTDFNGVPPTCFAPVSRAIGSFTTR